MIRFETEEQKSFVLEAVSQVSVPVPMAKRVAAILEALQAAVVGACSCSDAGEGAE